MTALLKWFSYRILLSGIVFPLAASNQWYVSPASTGGNGSFANPWTLQTALNQPSTVLPGDTIWLRGGTYVGAFVSNLNGALNQPIIVRSYPGEWAVIDRAATGLFPRALEIRGSWAWFWGFEVTNSNTVRSIPTTGSNPDDGRPEDIVIYGGRNIKLINLIVHDGGNGINDNSGGVDTEVYGNIVYHNGWLAPDRGHGHGIYSQNQTGNKRILDNILFSGFNHGIHIYGSSAAYLNNFDIEGNIGFNSGMLQSYFARNFLVGGSGQCLIPYIANNYSYFSTVAALGPGSSLNLGYAAGCTNAVLRDNYLESTTAFIADQNLSMTGNTFAGEVDFAGDTPGNTLSSYPGNTQIPYGTRPTGTHILVRPNQYEPGRGHIAIFNWSGLSSVNVDVSTILTVGTPYEVRDAQNIFGPPIVSGTYSGGTIAIPMTGTTMVAPVGITSGYFHTNTDFGAFVVIPPGTIPGGSSATTVATPVISPIGTNWTAPVAVTLSSATPGASIYFTTDGSNPTNASQLYVAPFTLNASATVKAKAVKSGATDSPVASATYTITLAVADTTPPVRFNGTPTGVLASGTTTATLALATDESATCSYSTSDVAYTSMTRFTSTGGVSHSTNISGLANGASYTYYIRCSDTLGNINSNSFLISFSIALAGQNPVVPASGLKLWLRADAGVVLNGSNVSLWTDQSGSGTNAAQTSSTAQPVLVPGAVNGQPVVRFDGTGRHMTFNLPVNGLAGMTLMLVTANSPDLDGDWNGVLNAPLFWNETTSWGSLHLSPFQRVVKYRFGTTQASNLPIYTRPSSIGSTVTLSTAIKNGTSESLYVNGALALSQTGKLSTTAGIQDTGNLGRGYNNDSYFTGDIAEVLVYNRALSDAERQQAEQYLLNKYTSTIDTTPPVRSDGAPTGTLASGTTTATLSLSTNENATCAYSTSDVAYGSMTAFSSTGSLAHATNVTGLANGTSYTYYVRCRDALGNANPDSFLISFSVATPSGVATPSITPNGGSSNAPANVTLSSSTAGASIYYTTNGASPTTGSTLYAAQFTLNASATVKALAVKSGMADSAVASASFTIDTTPPVRSNGAPTGTLASGTTTATLSLSTDEMASCSYSTTDVAYGSMTAFSVSNALVHSTNVTGLTNGSSYTYYVRCRDTFGNINPSSFLISFSVATIPSGSTGWYQTGWHYRKAIRVDHTRVAGALTNFPVLISMADTDLKAQALTSGNDIVFTAGDGTTKLNHEIESYDSSTGALTAWVNVPSLNSVADTTLYLYFGNPASGSQSNAAGVWDPDFKAVWHLKENPATTAPQIKDSTVNGNHGASSLRMTSSNQSPGIIGGSLTFTGTNFINVPDSPTLDTSPALTVSTWLRTTVGGSNSNIISKGSGCISSGYVLWLNENTKGAGMPSVWVGNGGWLDGSGINLSDGAWHYLATSFDGAVSTLYVDGVLKGSVHRAGVLNNSSSLRLAFGACGNYFSGSLDEARVSGSARPAAWIATEFANGSAPGAFSQISGLETLP